MAKDKPETRFAALYDGERPELAHADPAQPDGVRRSGASGVDLLAGLLARFALGAQFWTWWQANSLPLSDAMDWRAWMTPEPGLVAAARIWTQNQFDPELTAMMLLAAALLMTASLALGFLTRLAGLAAAAGALWHILFILPEAWPTTLAWGALGLYLALRGAGPASLDWMAARLARLG
jgi:uncharacterized membrane protein YphA (DoxX/SURF4 family)